MSCYSIRSSDRIRRLLKTVLGWGCSVERENTTARVSITLRMGANVQTSWNAKKALLLLTLIVVRYSREAMVDTLR